MDLTSHKDEHDENQPAQAVQDEDSEIWKSPGLTPASFKAPTHFNILREQQRSFMGPENGTWKSCSLSH